MYEEQIAEIRQLPARLEAIVGDLNGVHLTTIWIKDEWTIAQVVHHLVDSHSYAMIKMKFMLSEDNPSLVPYKQELWAKLPDGHHAEIKSSLELLKMLHHRWCILLENLPDDAWERTALKTDGTTITVAETLALYAWHGDNHIKQIEKILAAIPESAM